VQSFVISQVCHRFTFLVFRPRRVPPSDRGEQCGLGGHCLFVRAFIAGPRRNRQRRSLCHHPKTPCPSPKSVAGCRGPQLASNSIPGQLVKAHVLGRCRFLKVALGPLVAEWRRALRGSGSHQSRPMSLATSDSRNTRTRHRCKAVQRPVDLMRPNGGFRDRAPQRKNRGRAAHAMQRTHRMGLPG